MNFSITERVAMADWLETDRIASEYTNSHLNFNIFPFCLKFKTQRFSNNTWKSLKQQIRRQQQTLILFVKRSLMKR